MFFKKRKLAAPTSTKTDEPSRVHLEQAAPPSLMDRAEAVSRALRSFEKQAYEEGFSDPDQELVDAREMVDAAQKIIRDGRLSYALLRQLLHEVTYWPSWSKRDDFERIKNFICVLTLADREEVQLKHRKDVITTVAFTFSDRDYKIIHLDKGWSPAPDSPHKWGDVSLYAGNTLVMEVSATSEATEDHWKFESVKALRIGDGQWMTDLLQMASDIERNKQARMGKYSEDAAREAAKNIEL
jgi:hypothetical protein